jgi:hypothetical protein
MIRTARLASLGLVASSLLFALPAAAQVVVHDHRSESKPEPPPPPSGGGDVRDHRNGTGGGEVVYRRRPGPRVMMPLRFDLGMTGSGTSHGYLGGVEARLGIHWASLSPKPTNFDIGLGVFGAVLAGPTDDTMPDANNDVIYGGAYLEVGQTLSHGSWWRTWASGRAEYLGVNAFDETGTGFGAAGRLTAEIYASGVGVSPSGIFLGTYAIGVYAEAGVRGLGPSVDALQVSGGLTFRTPLVFQ